MERRIDPLRKGGKTIKFTAMKMPTEDFVIRAIALSFCAMMLTITFYAVLSPDGLDEQGGEYYAALLGSMLTFLVTQLSNRKRDGF